MSKATVHCLVLMAASMTSAPQAAAAEFGLGVSAKQAPPLYLFADVGTSTRVELSARRATSRSRTETDFGDVVQSNQVSIRDQEYGAGVFMSRDAGKDARLYLGARLHWVDRQTRSVQLITFRRSDPAPRIVQPANRQDGFRIEPAVGFEYFLGQRFSVGGEASWSYFRLSGDGQKLRGDRTDAQVILRYHFR